MSSHSTERSLSVSTEETIIENSRRLYDRFRRKDLPDPDPPEQKDETLAASNKNEISVAAEEDSVLRHRIRGGASPNVNQNDKIMNADENNAETKGKENLLSCFAEYKAEKDVCYHFLFLTICCTNVSFCAF